MKKAFKGLLLAVVAIAMILSMFACAKDVEVTFVDDSGAVIATKTVKEGKTLSEEDFPEAPVKEGYDFVGWYAGDAKLTVETLIYGKVTFKATYEKQIVNATLTFKNGDATVSTVTKEVGTALTAADLPAAPTLADHHFLGWYVGETKVETGYVLSADATATAKFAHDVATVTFMDGDDVRTTVTKETGDTLAATDFPGTDPAKTGYRFVGWFVGETELTEGYTLSADVTAVAKFEKNTYKITFVVDGATVAELDVLYGELPRVEDLPSDPEKEGFAFDGWFNGEAMFDEDATVTDSATYTAKFTKNAYKVTFRVEGAGEQSVYVPMTGATLPAVLPSLPNTDSMFFAGWFNGTTKAVTGLEITEDVVFTAKYITVDSFSGVYYNLEKYMLFRINGTSVEVFGKSYTATFDATTGILTVSVAKRPPDAYEISVADDGVSLTVTHKYYDDVEEDTVTDSNIALTALTDGVSGKFRSNKSDVYTVENGVITLSGTSTSKPYFGIVLADGEGYRLVLKTSSYAKATEASVTVDEKGNWLLTEKGASYTKIYVANPVAFADIYCSATQESVYAFSLGEDKYVYIYKNGNAYAYTDLVVVNAERNIYTFTVAEETKTVQLKTKGSSAYFYYPGEEKGTYTGTLGDAVVDGFGVVTVNGTEYDYTVTGNYMDAGELGVLKVDFEAHTYEVAENIGYAGTYTVYENFAKNGVTLSLNGYGLATLTNAKGVATEGTYSVADGKLTLAGLGYTYNKAWTLTNDGKAMSFANSYSRYEIVSDDFTPATADFSDYYGYYTDGKDTFGFETEIDWYGNELLKLGFWLDSNRTYYPEAYWDGARLIIEGTDFDAGVENNKSDEVLFLVEFADGKITLTHYCTTGLDDDGYAEQDFRSVTYTKCEKPAVTFLEWAIGTWYTPEGSKVEITENALKLNGVLATDLDVTVDYYGVMYSMTVGNLHYTLSEYNGAPCFGATELLEGSTPELLKEAPEDSSNPFLGTWNGEDDLKLVFDKAGVLDFADMELVYAIMGDKAYFLASDGETLMTATVSGNTLTIKYTVDEESKTLTLTKDGGSTDPVEPTHDGFYGVWKDTNGNTLTFEDGNKVTFNNGTAYTVDYTLSDDGKTATFSTSPFDFVCKLSEDGTTISATLDDGDAPFPLTYTKQETEKPEEPTHDGFYGVWKDTNGNTLTFEDGNKVTFNNGTAYTVDYTLSDDGKTATFSTSPFEFVCKLSEDGTTISATLDDGDAPFPLTYTKQ